MTPSEEQDPGWTPIKDDVPVFPREALPVRTSKKTGEHCVVPWVPGVTLSGAGAFSEQPGEGLGHPLKVREGNSFDHFLRDLMAHIRNYNHWLYRLRRAKLMNPDHHPVLCHDMPRPPGHHSKFGEDTEEYAQREFSRVALDLGRLLRDGYIEKKKVPEERFSVLLDAVRVNDYIVSARVLAGSASHGINAAALRGHLNWSSSSHISPSSGYSSHTPW